jgi:peroxiredoxin
MSDRDHAAPVSPAEGWGVLHLFVKAPAGAVDAAAVEAAVAASVAAGHQVVTATILGHKADACVMAMGPDWRVLRRLQRDLVAAGLELASSYVSLSEVSEYAKGIPEEMKRGRLYPVFPPAGLPAFCFYPMSKQRGDRWNWYALPYDEREELMRGHGKSGRAFAGRITQFITGSTGLDDFEWGVTLFGRHPDDLKEVVYTMRFDEASALYAEFGPFWVGYVCDLEELLATIVV